MFVNIAVLKEPSPLERRVALEPAVVAKLIARGARLHVQPGVYPENEPGLVKRLPAEK